MAEAKIEDVRNDPDAYLERAAAGEEIVVVRGGREVARIVPSRAESPVEPVTAEADMTGQRTGTDPADLAEIDAVIRRRIESGVFPTVQEINRLIQVHGESAWTELSSMRGRHGGFPDLTEFRRSIKVKGESPLEALLAIREETRY